MLLIANVRPEATLLAAGFTTHKHLDVRIIGPHHRGLERQSSLQIVERLQQLGGRTYPIAQRAASDVQSMTYEDVFLT